MGDQSIDLKSDHERIEWVRKHYLNEPEKSALALKEITSDDAEVLANAANLSGLLVFQKGLYIEALGFYKKALAIAKANQLKEMSAKILLNLSSFHIRFRNYKEAIDCAFQCLNYDFDRWNALSFYNLSLIYGKIGDEEKEIEFQKKSRELNEALNLTASLFYDYFNEGNNSIFKHKQYDKAIQSFEKCLILSEEANLTSYKASVYESIAVCYNSKKEFDKAIEYADKALKLALKYNAPRDLLIAHSAKAKALFELRKYEEAISECISGLKYNEEDVLEYQYALHEIKIDSAKIVDKEHVEFYFQDYVSFLKESNKVDLKEGEQINELLEYKNQQLTEFQRINDEIATKNRELELISKLLAHDLKTPARTIGSFTDLAQRSIEGSENSDLKEYFKYIKTGASEIYKKLDLSEEYLNFKLDTDKTTIQFNSFLTAIDLRLVLLDNDSSLNVYPNAFKLFFLRMIESFKNELSESDFKIYISSKLNQNKIEFIFSSSKMGYQDFDRELFKEQIQNDIKAEHAIMQKIVLLHEGDFRVLQTKQKGLLFLISLPV